MKRPLNYNHMKKNIAVVTGGNSSEYVISVKSADCILENLDEKLYNSYRIEIKNDSWKASGKDINGYTDVDRGTFSIQTQNGIVKFDMAIIMIHGTPGEDGIIQGYLETLGIPYTSSDVLASSVTFNKYYTKKFLESHGIKTAPAHLFHKNDLKELNKLSEKIGLPCFVKPNQAGSSFGVTRVINMEQLENALEEALKEDDEVLVEQQIVGRELTCGVLITGKNEYVFPVTEIVSKTDFFDFTAKYTVGMADEIVPAKIPEKLARQCQELSKKIYKLFNCRWFARIDYMVQEETLIPLEINTIPGMSKESIVPKMIRAAGMNLNDLLAEIIENNR